MRRTLALWLALVLAVPTAGAWATELRAPVDRGVSVRTSLLLAGAVHAEAPGGVLGAALADALTFGPDGATIEDCQDRAGSPVFGGGCAENETTHGASVTFRDGGFVSVPNGSSALARLDAAASVAALGGGNVTVNGVPLGVAGLYAGGLVALHAEGDSFDIRPLGTNVSVIVSGLEGVRYYDGSGFTLHVTQAKGLDAVVRGGFLAMPQGQGNVSVERAPLRIVERDLDLADLHAALLRILPPDQLERRADLVDAFGPFQVVPALLDGAVAARKNLTLGAGGAEARDIVLRVTDAQLRLDQGNWTGGANASYVVQGDAIAPQLGDAPRAPWWLVAPLALAAIVARVRTRRELPPRPARLVAHAAGVVAALALVGLALAMDARTLGVDPLREWRDLTLRSVVQLGLLAAGIALTAFLLAGWSASSLARSVLAWRGKPAARLVPLAVGAAVMAVFLVLWRAALIALVAGFVRL